MKTYTVAVLGATGAVGQEMIKILQERNFPVGKLVPLASARSAGKTVKFAGQDVTIQEACDSAFVWILSWVQRRMISPSSLLPPLSRPALCLWIILPLSAWTTTCP